MKILQDPTQLIRLSRRLLLADFLEEHLERHDPMLLMGLRPADGAYQPFVCAPIIETYKVKTFSFMSSALIASKVLHADWRSVRGWLFFHLL